MSRVAFLWDESFLWGLMSYKSLRSNGLCFDVVRSDEIRAGRLADYSLLFVPGGWASNKMKALGEPGISEIKKFVQDGGAYLGFCGGAGLATTDGIGLLAVKRKPTKERVPSFSGKIRLNLRKHEIWKDLGGNGSGDQQANDIFHAWWPSQFLVQSAEIEVVATYGEAAAGSFTSDLNVADAAALGRWDEMERSYGINLDPERLRNDPAVLEGRYGKGRVMLSLIHFDTPEDRNGAIVLRNLWQYLGGEEGIPENEERSPDPGSCPIREAGSQGRREDGTSRNDGSMGVRDVTDDRLGRITDAMDLLAAEAEKLIALGSRNFLWFWRNPMLLQWRRGVRGLEYCTLHVVINQMAGIIRKQRGPLNDHFKEILARDLNPAISNFKRFAKKAARLLVLERLAMQNARLTYEKCEDPEIATLRAELFANAKSHGGLFKEVLDELDGILFDLIRFENASSPSAKKNQIKNAPGA